MIDLSMLTRLEKAQFDENPAVLERGCVNVALYMRYSSDKQTEQSIEGQLRDAITFCKAKDYKITGVYIDRATSAHKDIEKRVNFLNMISDSAKKKWEIVLVWKLDRFARSRTDSAIYKARLKKNGVRVQSVTENISENPEGIILEAVLEGMAEFYSMELSQKISRGMRESALKANSVGGQIPLGYKLENKKLVIDPLTAPLVQRAYELYTTGHHIREIIEEFNDKGYTTACGKPFTRSSFATMFQNKRYIGTYVYKDIEIPNAIPPIITRDMFDAAQEIIDKTRKGGGSHKGSVNYLLSGKVYCGMCGERMIGDNGRSRNGEVYRYYTCNGRKHHNSCDKKPIRKEQLEDWVISDAMELLTDENINLLADMAVRANQEDIAHNSRIPALKAKLEETLQAINHGVDAILSGAVSPTLSARVSQLEAEKDRLEREIEEAQSQTFVIEKPMVVYWLSRFKRQDIKSSDIKRQIVDLFIDSVIVYDLPEGGFDIDLKFNLLKPRKKKDKPCSTKQHNGVPSRICPNTFLFEDEIATTRKRHMG